MSGADTRRELIELAVVMIEEDGEAGVRVGPLARSAGVSVATIYHHFRDREDLVIAAQTVRFARPFESDVAGWARFAEIEYAPDAFRSELASGYLRWLRRTSAPRAARVAAYASSIARPAFHAAILDEQDRFLRAVAVSFDRLVERGLLPSDLDVPAAVAWVYSIGQSRSFIEHVVSGTDLEAWDRTATMTVLEVLTGDPTIPDGV